MKQAAEKEIKRMEEVFENIEILDKKQADEFYNFAQNYFEDSKYFFEKEKYIEAFEASIIAWAYLDAGIKLGFFKPAEKVRKYFTVEK